MIQKILNFLARLSDKGAVLSVWARNKMPAERWKEDEALHKIEEERDERRRDKSKKKSEYTSPERKEDEPQRKTRKERDERRNEKNKKKSKEKRESDELKDAGCCDKVVRILPQVSVCCCGCSLYTGVMAIGWVFLVFSSLAVAAFIVQIAFLREEEIGTLELSIVTYEGAENSTMVVFNVLLLVGVYKGSLVFLRISAFAYLFVDCVLRVLSSVILLILRIMVLKLGVVLSISRLVASLLWAGLMFYFTIVIKSHYVEIADEDDEE